MLHFSLTERPSGRLLAPSPAPTQARAAAFAATGKELVVIELIASCFSVASPARSASQRPEHPTQSVKVNRKSNENREH